MTCISLGRAGLFPLALLAAALAAGCPRPSTPTPKTGGPAPDDAPKITAGHTGPIDIKTLTVDNTPQEWWTRRDDTPWADETSLDGEKTLDADHTMANGTVIPANTYMRWRRLLPGYDVNPGDMYREENDEHFMKAHAGADHKFSGPGPHGENRMMIGSIGQPSNLNPILAQDTASSDIVYFVFARLIDIDHNWEPVPQLAEGFTISPDGLVYTYYMREGATFSDGNPITAHDVEFTYSSINNPDVNSPRKGDFGDLDRVEVIDDYTVAFHLKQVYSPFDKQPTYGIMPRDAFNLPENRDMNTADFNLNPIGGGPYVFEKSEGEDYYLRANPDFYGRKAPIDQIIFKRTPGLELEQKMLERNEIDLGAVLIADLDKVQKEHPEIREFRTAYGLSYSYMGFNHKSAFFNDLKVRQAIAHAVNRQNLVDQVILGHGSICNANIPPMSPYFKGDVPTYEYNPTKAKDLLTQAGWADSDGDGILDKGGRKFSFELLTNEGNNYRKKTAELIQADLKAVGIEAKPRIIEWSSFINQFIHEHNFEAFILGWSLSVDPDDYTIFHSTQYEEGLNYGFYANPTVDQLLEEGRRTVGRENRIPIYHRIQEELAKDLPYLFLYYTKKQGGILKRIQGHPQVEPNDSSYLVPPLSAYTWWVKGFEPKDSGPMLSATEG
ncbi:MAG TPA: peptide-binding protein [bacterium]|nr:peptide-binding protein [bacterium]